MSRNQHIPQESWWEETEGCFDAKKFKELNIGFQKQDLKDTDVVEL